MTNGQAILVISEAVKLFPVGKRSIWNRIRRKPLRYVHAVDDVSLDVARAETLVLLGESGSGKTTLGRLVVGLETLNSGHIDLGGNDIRRLKESGELRGRLQMVFQDPTSSLDPYMKVLDCVTEPLRKSKLGTEQIIARATESLRNVGLEEKLAGKKPSELSQGQRQRVAVARAIVSKPDVIVLDEPTSSIDVSLQAQVLNLLVGLQKTQGFTYLLITHDPNVARYMADHIAVMYLGKVAEYGTAESILHNPRHPYTQALLASAPDVNLLSLPKPLSGEPPSMVSLPKGCRFAPRCPYVMERCKESQPSLFLKEGSLVACYLFDH
jgi:oligopeptide/dipeptide ABC transporter ATP-binding protein